MVIQWICFLDAYGHAGAQQTDSMISRSGNARQEGGPEAAVTGYYDVKQVFVFLLGC